MVKRTLKLRHKDFGSQLELFINGNNELTIMINHDEDDPIHSQFFYFESKDDIDEFINELQKLKKELYGK